MQVLKKSTCVWGSSYKSGVEKVNSRGQLYHRSDVKPVVQHRRCCIILTVDDCVCAVHRSLLGKLIESFENADRLADVVGAILRACGPLHLTERTRAEVHPAHDPSQYLAESFGALFYPYLACVLFVLRITPNRANDTANC